MMRMPESPKARPARRGMLMTEVVVAIAVMGVVAALAVEGAWAYRRISIEHSWRRAALWAADAQLQRCQAGAALDSMPPDGVIPEGVSLATEAEAGQEMWEGFELVTVTATVTLPGGRLIHEAASGYKEKEKGKKEEAEGDERGRFLDGADDE